MCSRYPGHFALQLDATWPGLGEASADDDSDRNPCSAAVGNYVRYSRRRRNNDRQIYPRWNSFETGIGWTTYDLAGRRMDRNDLAGEARLNCRQVTQEQGPSLACGGRSSDDGHSVRGEQGVLPISHDIPSTASVNRLGAPPVCRKRTSSAPT